MVERASKTIKYITYELTLSLFAILPPFPLTSLDSDMICVFILRLCDVSVWHVIVSVHCDNGT